MDQITALPPRNHNNPPDPIDQISAAYEADRIEADNWLDGAPVENEGQMKACDQLRKAMRNWRMDLERGKKDATAPLYDAYKAEGERWVPTIDDAKRYENALVAALDSFKRRLAAEKAEVQRRAWQEAETKRLEAEKAALAADASNIEEQRHVAVKQVEAEAAMRAADAAKRDKVPGLRTVTRYEVEAYGAAINDIATNDKDAIRSFVDDYVRRHHKARAINGVRVWTEKEAF